jgi:hypothetical protein
MTSAPMRDPLADHLLSHGTSGCGNHERKEP